jgi:D-arabinose 1-dehydrogenase-like Zn-dependent alcohol dehydrogenase
MFRVVMAKGVRPCVESFSMSDANAALARLAENQIRYRAVLLQDLGGGVTSS